MWKMKCSLLDAIVFSRRGMWKMECIQVYFKDVPLTPMPGADTGMDAARFTGSDKRILVRRFA